jgi:hypothetical protein
MGQVLDKTSLPLVAEEAYWQAFMRDQSSRYPLECLVACMRRTKRYDKAQSIVEQAYAHNYWNLDTRELLMQVESSEGVWENYFEVEERIITKFQSMYRAYVIRKDFIVKMRENLARILAEEKAELEGSDDEEMAPEAKKEKQDLEKLIKAKCAALMAQGLRMRFISWKVFVHERVRLKRKSATLIQGLARKYNAKKSFRAVLTRARNANYKFVQAAEMRVDAMKVAVSPLLINF